MSVIVRKAVRTDDKGIFEVEQDSFSIPWSLQAVQRELESERALYYVLEQEDGTSVGYAGLWQVLDEGQITNIALRKEFRHQGYGELLVRVLMEAAWEAGCTEIFLEVRISNQVAIHLYRKLGYEVLSVRKHYYSDPVEDAYVMDCKKEAYPWVR